MSNRNDPPDPPASPCRGCGGRHGSVNVEILCMRARIDVLEDAEKQLKAFRSIGAEARKIPVTRGGKWEELQTGKRAKGSFGQG